MDFYLPVNMTKAMRGIRTPADALATASDSLTTLCLAYGEKRVEANLRIQFATLQEYLGVKNKMSELFIDELVAEIVGEFRQLTMADVHVIMRRAKTGEYGEYYERLSIPKVMTWFRKYYQERIEVAMERNEREAEKHKYSYMGSREKTIVRPKDIVSSKFKV